SKMSYSAATGKLTLIGSDGVETIGVDSSGALGAPQVVGTAGASDSASAGNATFYVNPTTGTLTGVFDNSGTAEVVTVTPSLGNGNGLAGASSVTVSADGKFVYVASNSGNTLSVFSVTASSQGSTTTHSLSNIQALHNGDAAGTHGLAGTVQLVVTPDNNG